ncbi:MAG TPA: hypothetical protein VF365_09850 [Candidatus Limnocylindria bacterium]
MRARRNLAAIALPLLLAACAGAGDAPSAARGSPVGEPVLVVADGEITDPGMSVADALGHRATDDLVTVSGALFVDADGTVLLCDAIAESFPPQCGGERIVVEGLDLDAIGTLQTEGEVSWAEGMTLLGSVE